MSNKIKNPFKMVFSVLFVAVLAIFFLFTPSTSSAQYSQVNSYGNFYTYVDNYAYLNITTTNAGNITGSSAVLNGQVNGSNLYNTYNLSTWFEYGTNANLGYATVHNSSNSGYASFSSTVANLNPNTIYYYRAVGQSPQGVFYGVINSFRTDFASTSIVDNPNNNSLHPTAITNPAAAISENGAKLNSLILNSSDDSTDKNEAVQSSLGANVLSSGAASFLPGNMFGWLLLIILVLVLILAGKHLYGQFGSPKKVATQEHAHSH